MHETNFKSGVVQSESNNYLKKIKIVNHTQQYA